MGDTGKLTLISCSKCASGFARYLKAIRKELKRTNCHIEELIEVGNVDRFRYYRGKCTVCGSDMLDEHRIVWRRNETPDNR